MFKQRTMFAAVLIAALCGTGTFGQANLTYYVSTVGNDNHHGLSQQRAFRTIQRGIDAAAAGDTVLVAAGIYAGQGNKNLDFSGRAITLKSSAGAAYTVIDCQDNGRGLIFQSNETRQSVLDGFTIINGNVDRGGGIYCLSSSPTIKNCVVKSCYGFNCGGIYCRDGAAATIKNCVVIGNAGSVNGGIRVVRSNTQVVNCVIAGNVSDGDGGGGGIRCDYGPGRPTFVNCTIAGNHATENGGGFWAGYGSQPSLKNSILWGNVSAKNGNNIAISTQTLLSVDYSDVQGGQGGIHQIGDGQLLWGTDNLNVNPQFADVVQGDYHLKSKAGRFVPLQNTWVKDTLHSPCIDAGDPASDFSQEKTPNGARINLGAYGGTVQASLSSIGAAPLLPGDVNGDGIINILDLSTLIDTWLALYGSYL